MRILLTSLLTVTAFGLAGCDTGGDESADDGELSAPEDDVLSDTTPDEADQDDETSPPTSILRPDIEVIETENIVPLAPEPLEPLEVTIGFPEGGSQLDEEAREALEGAVGSEQMQAGGMIVLRGHSDAGGSDAANMRVSRARARRVQEWLVENGGVDRERIEVIAFGEQNPVRPNALPDGTPNEEGRARNRRVEMIVRTGDEPQDAESASEDTEE